MIEISIVIPVFNSESNLKELVSQIQSALEKHDHEIIMVDDRSKDNSWEVIKEISTSYANVTGLRLNRNYGQDNAILAGLHHVQGKYVVIMDDDLQHSPSDLLKLYDACQKGFDVVYADFFKKEQAFWKNLGSWVNGKVASLLLNKPKGLYISPYKIIKKKLVDEIIKYRGQYPYIDGIILNLTQNVSKIPATHYKRNQGESNFTLGRSVKLFLKIVTSFSIVPLRISTYLGFIVSLFGFLLIPYYLYEYFTGLIDTEGWTTITILLLILIGLVLFSLGIIGEYLGRIYMLMTYDTRFLVSETVGKEEEPE
ncbi:glycosyltransferase family 2 protein [bacterium]|nr:glycosyltransferase family 2 protein [bacterium]